MLHGSVPTFGRVPRVAVSMAQHSEFMLTRQYKCCLECPFERYHQTLHDHGMMDSTHNSPGLKTPLLAVVCIAHWNRDLVHLFRSLEAMRTVCDADPDRSATVGQFCPGTTFALDFDLELQDFAVTAVAIATPAARHYAMALPCHRFGSERWGERHQLVRGNR